MATRAVAPGRTRTASRSEAWAISQSVDRSPTLNRVWPGWATSPCTRCRSITVPLTGARRTRRECVAPAVVGRAEGVERTACPLGARLRPAELGFRLLHLPLGRDPLRGEAALALERLAGQLDARLRLAIVAPRLSELEALHLGQDLAAPDAHPGKGEDTDGARGDGRAHLARRRSRSHAARRAPACLRRPAATRRRWW